MQASERNREVKPGASRQPQYPLSTKEPRLGKIAKAVRSKQRVDDCSANDKLPKQIDDIIEGESPKRFKRPKAESDIIAR